MARPALIPAAVLVLAGSALAQGQTGAPAVAYVQATVAEPKPSTGSLGYVTASGRPRVARVAGAARTRLANLRVGDEVILTLEGPDERAVITAVKVSQLTAAAPAAEPTAAFGAVPVVSGMTGVPSRPSWPNPYSRINPGLPFHPTRAARVARPAGGTLSVIPAGLVVAPASAPARAIAAPAVLVPAPAAPARADDASGVDALRARGARDFEAAVTRLAAEAATVDPVYARYQSSCPAVDDDGGSRPWFGLAAGATLRGADASCAALVEEIQHKGAPIRAGMVAAQEAARAAWVLPGTLRDIRRRHSMEWSGWDR
jgi:hypothetical protein